MKDFFLTNYSNERFIDHLKELFNDCDSFSLTVSFIKEAGLVLIKDSIENALERGVEGRIITSTYQNFTDIQSLRTFRLWMDKYPNFSCHIDYDSFEDNGFHTKGYIFEFKDHYELLVGSTNITRFALLKNIEWNVSLFRDKEDPIINETLNEFNYLWDNTFVLTEEIIKKYTIQIDYAIERWDMDFVTDYKNKQISPNLMQRKALKELIRYRDMGINKALIIAATASGKTFLAAFDARNFDAKRLLFIVHRDTILEDAKKTFSKVFMMKKSYGLFTGNKKQLDADFIFATNTMMATHLDYFDPEEFDYIVFDECHHITASTYKKIFNYFKPKFLLGLTATPERMDNEDVFSMFDKNVPYELRLRDAILNDLVVPFKYYGIRDFNVDYSDKDKSLFLKQYFDNNHCQFIAEQIEKYRPKGKLKAIAFCRSIEHANAMAKAMSDIGYCVTSLTGKNKTGERLKAYSDLQDDNNPLEIIFTVDILNEGIDVPAINMVLFLRPTESQTIFIQQLGRGLRKYEGKDFLTVLDFIGNSYDRSVQVAFAIGTISSISSYDKPTLMDAVRSDFKSVNLPGVEIHIDEYSKEEILKYIEATNFNKFSYLKQDYYNFKKYLHIDDGYPLHIDYLNNDCAPDLIRFMKSKCKGKKNFSYYTFLKNIDDDIPLFNDDEIKILDILSDSVPLTRREEFLIVKSIINDEQNINSLVGKYKRITIDSIKTAIDNLLIKKVIKVSNDRYILNITNSLSDDYKTFLEDLLDYGLERYDVEFGDFEGKFKLYANYQKDKVMLEIDGRQYAYMQGTKYDVINGVTYVFVGLKKDKLVKGNFEYKDKFISPSKFQWESVNNTLLNNSEGKKLLNTKVVHLFVRKVDDEDGIVLPFTYFGTGKFTNCRVSQNNNTPTLLFDIELDHDVPEEYRFDFQIPEEVTN